MYINKLYKNIPLKVFTGSWIKNNNLKTYSKSTKLCLDAYIVLANIIRC